MQPTAIGSSHTRLASYTPNQIGLRGCSYDPCRPLRLLPSDGSAPNRTRTDFAGTANTPAVNHQPHVVSPFRVVHRMDRQGLPDAVVVLRAANRRHEAGLAGIARRRRSDASLNGHRPTAQVAVKVLPEDTRYAVKCHRVDAGIEEAVEDKKKDFT